MRFLLDLDGTLQIRGTAVPGAAAAVRALREAGHTVRVFTNTDAVAPPAVAARIRDLGIPLADEELFTPVTAALTLLDGQRPLVLADPAVRSLFPSSSTYTHVLVGDCRQTLNYPALDAAFGALRAGASLVALQRGKYFRAADGDHIDTGAIVAALEFASGRTARVLGKPARTSSGSRGAGNATCGSSATTGPRTSRWRARAVRSRSRSAPASTRTAAYRCPITRSTPSPAFPPW